MGKGGGSILGQSGKASLSGRRLSRNLNEVREQIKCSRQREQEVQRP